MLKTRVLVVIKTAAAWADGDTMQGNPGLQAVG